jgi:hypothetical protein
VAIAALLFAGWVAVAAFFGPQDADNPLPGVFYVLLWVGLVALSLAVGPVWRAISVVRTVHRLLGRRSLGRRYPNRGDTGRRCPDCSRSCGWSWPVLTRVRLSPFGFGCWSTWPSRSRVRCGVVNAGARGRPVRGIQRGTLQCLATLKVGCVVAGHVAAVIAAHDRALRLLPAGYQLTGQLAMMLVMVGYTFTGLYLLFGG